METITAAARCLRTAADAERLVSEVVEDAGRAGAVWVEPSMWPGLFDGRLGSAAEAVDVVLAAGHGAAQLAAVAGTSLRHSGAPRDLVDQALSGIDAWLRGPMI